MENGVAGLMSMIHPDHAEDMEELGEAMEEMGSAMRKAAGVLRRAKERPEKVPKAFIEEEEEEED